MPGSPRPQSIRALSYLSFLFSLVHTTPILADYAYNMPRGVTGISRDIYGLHMAIFWVCVAIGMIVFSVMFYAIIWHRKSRGAKAAHFHEHPMVEIIWTIIPCFILIAMAIPSAKVLIKMSDTSDSDLSIKITGHQWRWEYEYLGKGVRFISNDKTSQDQIKNRAIKPLHYLRDVDKPLVLPVGKKIRFLTTASDVIHSWWVPDLGLKKDAIPGFINEIWTKIETPGTYRGQCAELCGVNHGFMPIVVEAKTEEEFNQWLEQAQQSTKQKASSKPLAPPRPASYPESCHARSACYRAIHHAIDNRCPTSQSATRRAAYSRSRAPLPTIESTA